MNILFLSHYFYPHIGGVEKHVLEIAKALVKRGNSVTVVTEKYHQKLKSSENIFGINVIRFNYPHIKIIGIKYIWFWFLTNHKLIESADIIHCHDVFVWYLFSKIIFPHKKVYTTFHGWEGVYPIPFVNIFLKRVSAKLSSGCITVGKYVGNYYGFKPNLVVYGAADKVLEKPKKIKNTIAFVGRLQEDTGIENFLEYLGNNKFSKISFIGDGPLKSKCQKFGKVYGFVNPNKYLKQTEFVVPAGYLSYIQAKAFGCKTITFHQNTLKKDYWDEIKNVNEFPNWDTLASQYLKLWATNRL